MKILSKNDIENLLKEGRIIIYRKNYVYDVTDWDFHPGGKNCLIKKIDTDVSIDYNFHSKLGKKEWKKFCIGKLNKANKVNCIIC